MSTAADRPLRTLADLLNRLGQVPPERIRFHPPPGTACEHDVLEIAAREDRLCELVDGVLVEKAMGYQESVLAAYIISILGGFVRSGNLGQVSGADGMVRLFPGLLRIPGVAFASWDRLPQRRLPEAPIPDLVPDLAVEVLSRSNTTAEMKIKVDEYFAAGVRQVWLVDARSRTVTLFSAADESVTLGEQDVLNGGNVLPGFTLSLCELFSELDRHG